MKTILIIILVGILLFVALWIRDKDKGEILTDEEEKEVYQEWEKKKEDEK